MINKILNITLFFILLFLSQSTQAHKITGTASDIKLAEQTITRIEQHLDYKYENLTIEFAKSYGEYRKLLKNYNGISPKKINYLVKNSIAINIWGKNTITINKEGLTKEQLRFYLAHELIHDYQANTHDFDYLNDKAKIEGEADILASRITGYKITSKNHNIPYEKLVDYKDWEKYPKKKVLEQIRWYYVNVSPPIEAEASFFSENSTTTPRN